MTLDDTQKELVGKALGKIPSGIGILTTAHGEEKSGTLVSWFQQCSFEPPMISLAMRRGRAAEGVLGKAKKFVLNLLHTNQKDMLKHFGKGFKPGEDPFVGLEIENASFSGLPVLKQSLVYLDCEVRYVHEAGDHQLIVGEVVGAGMEEEGQPMVHLRRSGFTY